MTTAKQVRRKARKVFGKVGFQDEGHKYSLNGEISDNPSVSSVYKKFIHEPDWETIAERKALREGTTKEILMGSWDDKANKACERGSLVHLFGEEYAKGKYRKALYKEACTIGKLQMDSMVEFFDTLPDYYEVVVLELKMYHEIFEYFGMADVALLDKRDGTLVILDHKTNEDIFKRFGLKCLLPPFQYLADMPYNHYQMQLSLYQILAEQMGYKISDRILVWHKHDGSRKVYHLQDFTETLRQQLAA